uniref:Uncharacterized protein n=1 Tax=Ananas comosus var. bracteatus TaxID=296719 RepID=A0A6V7PEB2_ANACO|nr:unnamed protein product [Ananas comosus var. bracteatus]
MDFFKSVFSADPGAPPSRNPRSEDDEDDRADDPAEDEPSNDAGGGDGWNLGGIIKTFATKSESVIQTYRRDLEEFRSGLKTETAAIRDAASRAVRDLPGSLEAGASAAQVSLESVGHAIDGIIAHGKDAILALDAAPTPLLLLR